MSSFFQEKDEEDLKNSAYSKLTTLINNLNEKTNISKLKEINSKCVDLILEDKDKKSLEFLKNLESFLETAVIDMKAEIPKKYLIIVLHNIACCYDKLKDLDNCLIYFEALLYHFDSSLEKKYKISITPEYFDSLIKTNYYFIDKKNLGDLILELRFCAKFHIQMSILLSKVKKHVDSLYHSKLAALICEDNLIKTSYLYQVIKNDFKNNKIKENGSSDELNEIKEQIKQNYKIVFELKKIVKNLRNNSHISNNDNNNSNNYNTKNNQKFSEKNYSKKKKINSVYNNYFKYAKNLVTEVSRKSSNDKVKKITNKTNINKLNYFNSYSDYRKNEIDIYTKEKILLKEIKNVFEKKFKDKDDWIKNLNIETIINISALNYEDLDLDSDPKYEILRDSLLEKVIMLSVSYFCISNELRFLSPDKNNKNINGEYYLYNALYLSLYFLPPGCPLVNHYTNSYCKNYKQGLDIIPEGQIMNYNIDIIKKEIFNENQSKINDFVYFTKAKKINMKIIEEKNTLEKNEHQITAKKGNSTNRSNEKKNKIKIIKKKGIVINPNYEYKKREKRIIDKNNSLDSKRKKEIINISDKNIFNKKYETNNSYLSYSQNSMNTSTEIDIKNMKLLNGNFGLIPNNNFIDRAKKSKIQELKAPKFKLNFNQINYYENNSSETQNSGNMTKDSIKEHIGNNIKMKILFNKSNKKYLTKKIIKIKKKPNNSDRKINCNNNNINNMDKIEKKKLILNNFKKIKNIKNNIYKNEKFNNIKVTRKFGNKNEINNNKNLNGSANKKQVFNNQLNKVKNTIKKINKNQIPNLVKYFRIKNILKKEKECLTERLSLKSNNNNEIFIRK